MSAKSNKTRQNSLLTPKQKQDIKLEGENIVNKIKQLIQEGNIKRLVVKDKEGKIILSLPVTVSIVGALILPPLVVIGAVAALLSECTITVERQ